MLCSKVIRGLGPERTLRQLWSIVLYQDHDVQAPRNILAIFTFLELQMLRSRLYR